MKIVNETKWQTSDLKKLCTYCVRQWHSSLSNWQKRNLQIHFQPSRRYHFGRLRWEKVDGEWKKKVQHKRKRTYGRAYIGGTRMLMFIPNPENTKDGKLDVLTLGWIIMHEMTHIVGQRHKDIKGSIWATWNFNKNDSMTKVFEQFEISPKEPPTSKPRPDVRQVRYERAKENLKRSVSKFRRYQNLVKKWQAKVRYYEQSFAQTDKKEDK